VRTAMKRIALCSQFVARGRLLPGGMLVWLLAGLIWAQPWPAQAVGDAPVRSAAGSGKKRLLLFAKDPATWSIVKGGASGKLVYREANGAFMLNAAGLKPQAPYVLVRVEEEPAGGQILARGSADRNGRLELSGTWHNWTRKFWVVAAEDVAGATGGTATLRAWHPSRYLFEEKPLGVPCDCPEPEEP